MFDASSRRLQNGNSQLHLLSPGMKWLAKEPVIPNAEKNDDNKEGAADNAT